eukprot:Colp12_sorted_trinity150504_noHs@7706
MSVAVDISTTTLKAVSNPEPIAWSPVTLKRAQTHTTLLTSSSSNRVIPIETVALKSEGSPSRKREHKKNKSLGCLNDFGETLSRAKSQSMPTLTDLGGDDGELGRQSLDCISVGSCESFSHIGLDEVSLPQEKKETQPELVHVSLNTQGNQKIGIIVRPAPKFPSCVLPCVYISHIFPGSVASLTGSLRVGDQIVRVNGCSIVGWSFRKAVKFIDYASQTAKIVLSVLPCKGVCRTKLTKSSGLLAMGFTIVNGVINTVERRSPAELADLPLGNRIIAVNGKSVVGKDNNDIEDLLSNVVGELDILSVPVHLYSDLVDNNDDAHGTFLYE